jgi:hypothetical protein
VDDKISELSAIRHKKDRDRRSREVVKYLRAEVDELTSRMREEKKWPKIDFANFCAVVSVGLGAWEAVVDHDLAFSLPIAAFGLAPAVYSAFRGSKLQLEDHPLAYSASAELALIEKPS